MLSRKQKNSQCCDERHQLYQLDGRGEELIQRISGLLLHGLGAVGVGIHGDLDVAVAHKSGNCLHGDIGFDHHGRTGVAKIVETDLLDGLILDESIPFLAHGIGLVGSAVRFADDQVRVGKGRAHGQLVHVVLDSGLFQFR